MVHSGKHRRREIRALVRRGEDLPRICASRGARYQKFRTLNAPDCLVAHAMQLWHDAEYALSIAEGYYDPAHPAHQNVVRMLREIGQETSVEELLGETRRRIMERLGPICVQHGYPWEFGALVRLLRKLKGRKAVRA